MKTISLRKPFFNPDKSLFNISFHFSSMLYSILYRSRVVSGVLPEMDGVSLLGRVPAGLQPPEDPGGRVGLRLTGEADTAHPLLQHRLVNPRDTHRRLV